MLHILTAPAPEAVEDIFLVELYGYHQTVGHSFSTHIMILDIRDIGHRVAHFEVDLVGFQEHVAEHLLQLLVDLGLRMSHLDKEVTVLGILEGLRLCRCRECTHY